jgi:hypothetical protein
MFDPDRITAVQLSGTSGGTMFAVQKGSWVEDTDDAGREIVSFMLAFTSKTDHGTGDDVCRMLIVTSPHDIAFIGYEIPLSELGEEAPVDKAGHELADGAEEFLRRMWSARPDESEG